MFRSRSFVEEFRCQHSSFLPEQTLADSHSDQTILLNDLDVVRIGVLNLT